jgi:hypothetical protein
MFPEYKSFKVDIKNLKFTSDEGIHYPKTAIISYVVQGKSMPVVDLFGFVDEEIIFQWIDEGKPILLDKCYIPKFSLSEYRARRDIPPRQPVVLNGFSARQAFFDAQLKIDFSLAVFESSDFNLERAMFSKGEISFDSAVFKCDRLDFSYVRFSNDHFDFKNVDTGNASVIFKNAVFGTGIKDFQYSEFGGEELNFINTEFGDGDVNFINAIINTGFTSFKVARFGQGKVDFHFAKFRGGDISFERTEFGDGRVDFRTVEFGSGKVNFNRATFGDGEVSFEASEMESGKFNMKRVRFGMGDLNFEQALFRDIEINFERTDFGEGPISFYRSAFKAMSLKFCHLDDYVDLRLVHCGSIDLSGTIVRDIIDLQPHEFELDVREINFAGMRLIGRIYISWKQNHVKRMIQHQTDVSNRLKAEQFRILKENFKNLGQYGDEDRSYVEFKRHESLADLHDSVSKSRFNAIWHYPLYLFKLGLFDRAGLYATSPVRVLVTMLSTFTIFSLLYFILISYSSADIIASVDDQLSNLAKSFYHSAITFLTIGYGDHYPYGSIRFVSSLEGFAGLFLMSYFTVAFVRKILR